MRLAVVALVLLPGVAVAQSAGTATTCVPIDPPGSWSCPHGENPPGYSPWLQSCWSPNAVNGLCSTAPVPDWNGCQGDITLQACKRLFTKPEGCDGNGTFSIPQPDGSVLTLPCETSTVRIDGP